MDINFFLSISRLLVLAVLAPRNAAYAKGLRTPDYLQALVLSSSSIKVSWRQPTNQSPSSTIFELRWKINKANSENSKTFSGGTSSVQLDNLKAFTMYAFRLRIGTVSGIWSNFTTYIYGRTGEGVPTAPPSNVTAFNTSAISIMVHWSPVDPTHRNGEILGFKVCYEEANSTVSSKLCYPPVLALGLELIGLKMYQNYWITVSAYTRVGDGPPSKPILVSTDEFVPGDYPRIVSLVPKTTSFFIKWSPIPKDVVNGILRGYYVLYFKVPMRNNNDKVVRVNADIKGVEIAGLERNTTYGVRLSGLTRVRGVIRNGVVSPTRNITTKYGAAAPGNLRGHSPCPTCLLVRWDAVKGPDAPSIIINYRVMYLKEGSNLQNTVSQEVKASKTEAFLKGLDKFSVYIIRVVAITVDGLGESSKLLKLATSEDAPSRAPGRVALHTTSAHSVRVEWSPVPDKYTNGIIRGYKVMYESKVSRIRRSTTHAGVINTVTVNATSLFVEIRGLRPYTPYKVWVLAFNTAGDGPPSSKMEVWTEEDVPSQAPRRFMIVATSANTIKVQWSPVSPQDVNGVLKGYRVRYNKKSTFHPDAGKFLNVNASINAIKITSLESNKEYVIRVAALTKKGAGPYSEDLTAKTIKDEPGRPTGVHVKTTSSRSVQVSWKKPTRNNGKVTRFMLKWSISKTASDSVALLVQEGHKIVRANRQRHVGISGLTPFKKYAFKVKEETNNSVWGPFSEPVEIRMPEDAPSVPLGLAVIEKLGTSLEIGWNKPEHPNGVIRKYVVVLSRMDGIWRSFIVEPPKEDKHIKFQFIIPDETAEYKITVQAFTSFPGRITEELTIQHLSSDHLVKVAKEKDPYLSKLPWLLCGLAVIIVLLVITLIIILVRRSARKNAMKGELPMTNFQDKSSQPVAVADLVEHCRLGHANNNSLFQEEFKSLEMLETGKITCEASLASYNKHKNRFPNILAYDKTRVLLKHCRGTPGSDYINANYVSGYSFPARYIATQSPLRETTTDFWRMVWEQECRVIVMLDEVQDTPDRPSCEQYWPNNGPLEYGSLAVSPLSTTKMSDFVIRKFIVWSTDPDCMDKREVTQLQYTNWPDQRIPLSTASFLLFHHKFKTLLPINPGPIVVHCSCGIGRTGTFIVIDAMLEQMETEGLVDVFSYVALVRGQRGHMIQNEEQYQFIYDVLRDSSICGRTEMTSQELSGRLLAPDPQDTEVNVKRACEFENLQDDVPGYPMCSSATNTDNVVKNRCPEVLPYEHNRIRLSVLPDISSSDYINASYIDGYNDGKVYIATQGPLKNTACDFWRMVWEQRCNTIVMLTDLQDSELEQCYQYWPDAGSTRFGKIWVTKINEEDLQTHTERVFKVKYHGNPDALLLYHFQYRGWPEGENPPSTTGLVYVNDQVQKIQRPSGPSGPIIVHCSDGAGRTGVFLTLALSIERLETEETVDIFQTVRYLRAQRTAMVRTTDQYSTCYQAIKAYLSWRVGTSRNVYV